MSYVYNYLAEARTITEQINRNDIEKMIEIILDIRRNNGRLFFLGVGGSAGNASHAVNDFRKIAGIESYSPCDNVSELTARTNDDGWESVFIEWLKGSHLNNKDASLFFPSAVVIGRKMSVLIWYGLWNMLKRQKLK